MGGENLSLEGMNLMEKVMTSESVAGGSNGGLIRVQRPPTPTPTHPVGREGVAGGGGTGAAEGALRRVDFPLQAHRLGPRGRRRPARLAPLVLRLLDRLWLGLGIWRLTG